MVFSSNDVRLSVREWIGVAAVLVAAVIFTGGIWRRIEPFDPGADYRMPYDLAEDYWLFNRYCGEMLDRDRVLVFGDSVVWGQYVEHDRTLTHFLNRQAGSVRFANAGLDGAHPVALDGLLEHHCDMNHRDVVLHLNLLWLTSPQSDLQDGQGARLNHPRLIPQFVRRPPAYRAPLSDRIGVVISRALPSLAWSRHVQMAYFDNADLAGWSVSRPYTNPLDALTLRLPDPSAHRSRAAVPWSVRGRTQPDVPWVALDESVQWAAFQHLVARLHARGNRVTVIVGPLNEHMLVPGDVQTYQGMVAEAERWLRERGIASHVPSTLPSDLYADLSHPLADGYALLAEQLWARGMR